jgi:hypothetical protein
VWGSNERNKQGHSISPAGVRACAMMIWSP